MDSSLSPYKQVLRQKTRSNGKRPWKFRLSWKILKKAKLSSSWKRRLFRFNGASSTAMRPPLLSPIRGTNIPTKSPYRFNSLANHLRITRYVSNFMEQGLLATTPTLSTPKTNISTNWREMHGMFNWDYLLNPLHPWLREEIIKYGELVGATYDAFDFDPLSESCGNCRYDPDNFFEELDLAKHGYKVSNYVYAMSHVDVPTWLERSHLGATWSKDSNWIGYVAVSTDEETARIGRRDILVAWRGTVAPSEWILDLKAKLQHIGHDYEKNKDVKVEEGFLSIYKSKSESTRYNKTSASNQVMQAITTLVDFYTKPSSSQDVELSLTITGHSLGGALALLNAHEAALSFPDLFITTITFAAPMVGNAAFKHRLTQLGVKTLRVVVKKDLVPRLPGTWVSERIVRKFKVLASVMNGVYMHVGVQLKLDTSRSPFLKQDFDILGFHNLEIYLHLVDGYVDKKSGFRAKARRNVALVNKTCSMLLEDLKIPEKWYHLHKKGIVFKQKLQEMS